MAHVTDLGFTIDELNAAIESGDVRSQAHPDFPELRIFNYCEEVQFKNKWNKITLACRGLILNIETGEVVARPWEKFFNLGQRDNRIDSNAPVEVTDKLDGSLGILYRRPDGVAAIATRGSFASEQAIHANEVVEKSYNIQSAENEIEHYTFLFEIIYPENRIVVDYKGMDDLVLLGAVNKERGYYLGPREASGLLMWFGPIAETFHAKNFVEAISLPDREGKEGYIIRSGNKIVKLKQADYVELHRIVTNLSPKTIWSMMGEGKTVDDICNGIPDEFYNYVKEIADELVFRAANIRVDAVLEFQKIKNMLWKEDGSEISRRRWANEIKKSQYAGLLFNLLDERDIGPVVWNMIRPKGDVKTLVEDAG